MYDNSAFLGFNSFEGHDLSRRYRYQRRGLAPGKVAWHEVSKVCLSALARQLSWLEHRPDLLSVAGSISVQVRAHTKINQ